MQIKSSPAMEFTAKKVTTQNNATVKASFADKKVSIVLGTTGILAVGSFVIAHQYFGLDCLPSIIGAMSILVVSAVGLAVISTPEKIENDFVPDVAWEPIEHFFNRRYSRNTEKIYQNPNQDKISM